VLRESNTHGRSAHLRGSPRPTDGRRWSRAPADRICSRATRSSEPIRGAWTVGAGTAVAMAMAMAPAVTGHARRIRGVLAGGSAREVAGREVSSISGSAPNRGLLEGRTPREGSVMPGPRGPAQAVAQARPSTANPPRHRLVRCSAQSLARRAWSPSTRSHLSHYAALTRRTQPAPRWWSSRAQETQCGIARQDGLAFTVVGAIETTTGSGNPPGISPAGRLEQRMRHRNG